LANSRAKIIEVAVALFQQRGYGSVSMKDLCEGCGLTKGTIYYHFSSKDEIMHRYFEDMAMTVAYIMPSLIRESNQKEQLLRFVEFTNELMRNIEHRF
jgi:AcrR family transcriptional regulator